jgi:ribosomal protein S27E
MLGRNASMTDETPKRILCLGCASIDVVTPTSDEYIRCPHCNRTQKVGDYERIIKKISNAIVYGYLYRTKYEKQYSQYGEVRTLYSISECAEALKWIGLASLSGIIGAASWDLVKVAIKKIREQLGSSDLQKVNFLSDEDNFNQFILYLREFYEDLPSAQNYIKLLIYKEIRIDSITAVAPPIILNIFDKSAKRINPEFSKEEFVSTISKKSEAEKNNRIEPLSNDEMSDIWKNIDLSG